MVNAKAATPTKQDVLRFILENPSCTPADIYHTLGLNRGTTRYHVQMLIRQGKVTSIREGKYLRLFHISNDYKHIAEILGSSLNNDNDKRILRCIRDEPGITLNRLSKKIKIRKARIIRLVDDLSDKRIVSPVINGKRIKLFLCADADMMLRGVDL